MVEEMRIAVLGDDLGREHRTDGCGDGDGSIRLSRDGTRPGHPPLHPSERRIRRRRGRRRHLLDGDTALLEPVKQSAQADLMVPTRVDEPDLPDRQDRAGGEVGGQGGGPVDNPGGQVRRGRRGDVGEPCTEPNLVVVPACIH